MKAIKFLLSWLPLLSLCSCGSDSTCEESDVACKYGKQVVNNLYKAHIVSNDARIRYLSKVDDLALNIIFTAKDTRSQLDMYHPSDLNAVHQYTLANQNSLFCQTQLYSELKRNGWKVLMQFRDSRNLYKKTNDFVVSCDSYN